MILVAGCRLEAMKSAVQDEGSALHTVGVRERGSRREREREGPLFISFWLFKTDGSLCAERKCLLTQLAHYWWLPANDNNGIGECEQQCSLLSSDALRTEGWQPADTVARPPEPGGASAGTHRTSRRHPAPPRCSGALGYRTSRGREHGDEIKWLNTEAVSQVMDQDNTWRAGF